MSFCINLPKKTFFRLFLVWIEISFFSFLGRNIRSLLSQYFWLILANDIILREFYSLAILRPILVPTLAWKKHVRMSYVLKKIFCSLINLQHHIMKRRSWQVLELPIHKIDVCEAIFEGRISEVSQPSVSNSDGSRELKHNISSFSHPVKQSLFEG